MLGFIPHDRGRQVTHVLLALFTFAGCYLTYLLKPELRWFHILTIALGYIALWLIFFTLIVGPFRLLVQRRNPVNINLRRDTGIWAGITGTLHVIFGFQVHMGGDIVLYFFERTHHGLKLALNLFGFSNDVGAVATPILVGLLLLSNDLSVRWLRGPLWKWLQRSNYVLAVLALAHTLGYQINVEREWIMSAATILLTVVVLIAQLSGVVISILRRR